METPTSQKNNTAGGSSNTPSAQAHGLKPVPAVKEVEWASATRQTRVESTSCLEEFRAPVQLTGPVEERRCRDVVFLTAFCILAVYMTCVVIAAASRGDYMRFTRGVDDYGNICGRDNMKRKYADVPLSGQDMRAKPYLLVRYLNGKGKECVDTCPASFIKTYFKICINSTFKGVFEKENIPDIEAVADDIVSLYREIIYMVLIGIVFTVLVMLTLRFLAVLVVWSILAAAAIATIVACGVFWYQWDKKKRELESMPLSDPERDMKERRLAYWLFVAVVTTLFMAGVLLMLIVMRKKVKMVTALFKEASGALADMPGLFLQPFVTSTCLIVVTILWLLGLVCVVSVGHPYLDETYGVVKYAPDDFFVAMLPFYMLFFFWLVQIILNSQLFVIASSVSTWYFTRDKTHMKSPVTKGVQNLIFYHLGSIAFGSLLVACIKLLRALVKAIEYGTKCEWHKFRVFAKVCEVTCQCVQQFLTYVNRNAFIAIAIHGCSFVSGAKRAFAILAQHAMDVIAINSVGDFVLFLAKATVTLCTALCGIEMVNQHQGVHYKWVPVIAGAILAYFIADSCISIYEMTVDTLFVCFCEDSQQNDGIIKPYFMTDTFKTFIEDSKHDRTTKTREFH